MPDVSHLLTVPSDDPSLAVPDMPTGTWRGELRAIRVQSTNRDGEPLTDKNGDHYNRVRLLCIPEAPEADVDPKAAKAFMEAGGPEEVGILAMSFFVRRKRDIADVNHVLDALGVPRKGRSYAQIADEFKGGIPCRFEVAIDDEWGAQIKAIYPAA